MRTVTVKTSTPYEALIGKGLFSQLGMLAAARFGQCKVFVMGDINTMQLYGGQVSDSLRQSGMQTSWFQFTPGEAHKTVVTVETIIREMKAADLTRTDMLLALGGGITGDMGGFAASVYKRGIRFIQAPTSLLAMVDASVGGKTGVNLSGFKNQIGTFWQPSMVAADIDALGTLPEREFSCGMAEVVKYGCIRDAKILDLASDIANGADRSGIMEDLVERCISIKADLVARDERDSGERLVLNFGHTVGHAIEKCTEGELQHGEAVSIGMVAMARTAEALRLVSGDYVEELTDLLVRLGLPVKCPVDKKDALEAIALDKKRHGDQINIVVPTGRGSCAIVRVTMARFAELLKL